MYLSNIKARINQEYPSVPFFRPSKSQAKPEEFESKLYENFNSKKFEVPRHGKNDDLKQSTCSLTPNSDLIIDKKEPLGDLGIMMSNDASFSIHVESVCSKVKQKNVYGKPLSSHM